MQHDFGTFTARHLAPRAFVGSICCSHSIIDVFFAGTANILSDDEIIRGVAYRPGLTGFGRNILFGRKHHVQRRDRFEGP